MDFHSYVVLEDYLRMPFIMQNFTVRDVRLAKRAKIVVLARSEQSNRKIIPITSIFPVLLLRLIMDLEGEKRLL